MKGNWVFKAMAGDRLKHFRYYLMEFYSAYVLASIDLAHEYVKLSKMKRATSIFNQTLNSVKTGQVSDEAVALFYLRFAESSTIAEDVARRYLACFFCCSH